MGKPIITGTAPTILEIQAPVQGVIALVNAPNSKILIENQPAWFKQIDFIISGATDGTYTQIAPEKGTIMATGKKVQDSTGGCVLDGDQVILQIKGQTSAKPPVPGVIVTTITAKAIQQKVQGE